MTPPSVRLLLLTGPPGSGKSSVASELHVLLTAEDTTSAVIEADQLRRCHPPLSPEQVLRHVATLAQSYAAQGYSLLLLTETVEDATSYGRLLDTLAPAHLVVVRLEAQVPTLQSRIRAREPAAWGGLDELLSASARLRDSMRLLPSVDIVVDTEHTTAADVAGSLIMTIRQRFPALLSSELA